MAKLWQDTPNYENAHQTNTRPTKFWQDPPNYDKTHQTMTIPSKPWQDAPNYDKTHQTLTRHQTFVMLKFNRLCTSSFNQPRLDQEHFSWPLFDWTWDLQSWKRPFFKLYISTILSCFYRAGYNCILCLSFARVCPGYSFQCPIILTEHVDSQVKF